MVDAHQLWVQNLDKIKAGGRIVFVVEIGQFDMRKRGNSRIFVIVFKAIHPSLVSLSSVRLFSASLSR